MKHSRWDSLGMVASTLCAIHCAAMPFAITMLPLLGLSVLANPWFEWGMIGIALFVGVFTIVKSYFFVHRQWLPILLLLTGLAVVVAGRLYMHGWLELVMVPAGGLAITCAHFFNSRCLHICET
ncbi:MerC domain-containing protein [Mucilaginibacter sp. KACC 22063]|uniref:MerC domain-containing protein n=1 Tax=Mucilaginibacter sp. KACC 22063 TaxID=3025666 RepID=UPI002365EBD8|nr:MerC domain-containing protein [Mucilaginibacter sp. KACC 22063]WDF53965.1 MerC domain-containing protein [Mucilaginibacter sp. KACC 22063]